jgi:hypothetical protein
VDLAEVHVSLNQLKAAVGTLQSGQETLLSGQEAILSHLRGGRIPIVATAACPEQIPVQVIGDNGHPIDDGVTPEFVPQEGVTPMIVSTCVALAYTLLDITFVAMCYKHIEIQP